MSSFKISQTKVVATTGPASRDQDILSALIDSGVNILRLNLSHDTHEEHGRTIDKIKRLREEKKVHVAILGDLQGPKLRIGMMPEAGAMLENGSEFILSNAPCEGDAHRAYMNYPGLAASVKAGDSILIDDGKIMLQVVSSNEQDTVVTKVLKGGLLRSRKGVNLPDTKLDLPCLTEKDMIDLQFAIEKQVDWIGLSFVRSAEDIRVLRDHIRKAGSHIRIVAKIEKPEAIQCIDEIIDESDAIMVARGDLGVEVSFERVPLLQKEIVRKCNQAAKPVIIATQMMESMISNFAPTRAEANDVANAVLDGADALMLSGETSMGEFPVESVKAMHRIIEWTESRNMVEYPLYPPKDEGRNKGFLTRTICYNAANMAKQSAAKAIVVFTNDWTVVNLVASHRIATKIIVFTTNEDLLQRTSLVWGAEAIQYPVITAAAEAVDYAKRYLLNNQLLQESDMIVYVGSIPFVLNRPNIIRIGRLEIN